MSHRYRPRPAAPSANLSFLTFPSTRPSIVPPLAAETDDGRRERSHRVSRSPWNVSPPSNRPQQPPAMFLKPEARLLPGPPVEQLVRQFLDIDIVRWTERAHVVFHDETVDRISPCSIVDPQNP